MEYQVDFETFKSTFVIKEGKSGLHHRPGTRCKLFPYTTHLNILTDLDNVVGRMLCDIQGIKPIPTQSDTLSAAMKENMQIEPGKEEDFDDIVRRIFFDDKGMVRPINIWMLEHITDDSNDTIRIAEYLSDVLGNKEHLNECIQHAKEAMETSANALEKHAARTLNHTTEKLPQPLLPYWKVTTALTKPFEDDFEYVLSSQSRTRDCLIPLIEFYYFTYTAQACLHLERFFFSDRNEIYPLYYALEWEKTSQSRKCFTEGWQSLALTISKLFSHAVVIEMLSQTTNGEIFDYEKLGKLAELSPEQDHAIADEISKITSWYRTYLVDCPPMTDLEKKVYEEGEAYTELHFLFDNVRTQFEFSNRRTAARKYADSFEGYCSKYIKRRGRSGNMLNLSEETLILLTKLSIKNREQLRLKEVFREFEKRGVFLDSQSKDQVADYYERLNLIEKKSDSGDAKYVKRIL